MKYHKWMNEYNKRNHSIFLCCEIYKDLYLKSFNCISKRYLPSCHGNGNCRCNHCPFYEKLDNFFKYFREIGGLKMRKILFRGKRVDNGEWVYGLLCRVGDTYANIVEKSTEVMCTVLTNTIGQCTGLTDKSGKNIFEGDIVALHDYIIGEIVFECGTFGIGACKPFDYGCLENKIASTTGCYNSPNFCYNDNFISLWELYWNYNQDENILEVVEIIGNIHDNPKLLNNFKNQ